MLGGLSLVRAGEIERDPEKARPGELERLRRGVDTVASEDRSIGWPSTTIPAQLAQGAGEDTHPLDLERRAATRRKESER